MANLLLFYFLLIYSRFPPPSPRLHHRSSQPFNSHGHLDDQSRQDHHERHNFRDDHRSVNHRLPERSHHQQPRQIFPWAQHNIRQSDKNVQGSQYDDSIFYQDVQTESCHVNSMGDVDHRQSPHVPHSQDSYQKHRISPWANPPYDNKKHYYEDRIVQKSSQHLIAADESRTHVTDYTGHRPPASDHYGGTSGPTTNNNNTSFSRSVDDTVDIIRKRLMNRNEPQRLSQDAPVHSNNEQEVRTSANQYIQQEQPVKKRTPKQKQIITSNCDKMKTNIVHQLFKMDKDRIHKLMDDPGSSSKFEYAISSLITESQNSLNRQKRSAAEKSLYSSSTDFIHNDNNTIYEDIFMKQMQCILDPQDTVLLEDIKPMVMAELSKVLQLDEMEQRYNVPEDQSMRNSRDEPSNYPCFDSYNYDQYPQDICYNQDQISAPNYDNLKMINLSDEFNENYDHNTPYQSKPLFERRPTRKSDQIEDRRQSIDSQRQRRSIDNPVEDMFKCTDEPTIPLFDTNTDQLSEDEDTFAELDKQYHVAVDHNFIGNDDLSSRGSPAPTVQLAQSESIDIKSEIDNQLQPFVDEPLPLFPLSSTGNNKNLKIKIKQEVIQSIDVSKGYHIDNTAHRVEQIEVKQEYVPKPKDTDTETEKTDSNIIKTSPSNSRKRSIDQRPSHRKEKRKKSESSQSDSTKLATDKNIITLNNDPAKSSAEKHNNGSKPFCNMFLTKDQSTKAASKDTKKVDTSDKSYSDKYVKRKEPSKKPKEKENETSRKRCSSSSSQSIVILSPKDSITSSSQTPTKSDPKVKLKTFDMFVEQPKKSSAIHHAHRNTASSITPTKPIMEENKLSKQTGEKINYQKELPAPIIKKIVQTKHAGTQVIKRLLTKETQTFQSKSTSSKFCQTEKKKAISKFVQTDNVSLENSKRKATDAFERMKEIDMEIQVLLQEKFKLYSSLESKDSSSMPTLGMTVLNVTHVDESKDGDDNELMEENAMSADDIADDFTNIPAEELEQIALESVQEVCTDSAKVEKRSLRQKVLQEERKSSESPTSSKQSHKKATPPNICLIEQIITDERPIEDIISLDDLEEVPAKSKKKPQKTRPKKKSTKRSKSALKKGIDVSSYDLRDCSVVLIQTDVSKFIKEEPAQSVCKEDPDSLSNDLPEAATLEQVVKVESSAVEEETVNDLQFDMLDVSEDIVIGDNCEIKCNEGKDMHGRAAISEDIILDNSQSSADDVFTAEANQTENECKTYDYSTDEKLRRDSVMVTGNADAVLAIEVSIN